MKVSTLVYIVVLLFGSLLAAGAYYYIVYPSNFFSLIELQLLFISIAITAVAYDLVKKS
jgi:Ca2+/Na+ antiporter